MRISFKKTTRGRELALFLPSFSSWSKRQGINPESMSSAPAQEARLCSAGAQGLAAPLPSFRQGEATERSHLGKHWIGSDLYRLRKAFGAPINSSPFITQRPDQKHGSHEPFWLKSFPQRSELLLAEKKRTLICALFYIAQLSYFPKALSSSALLTNLYFSHSLTLFHEVSSGHPVTIWKQMQPDTQSAETNSAVC